MLRKDGPGAAYSLGIIVRGPVLLSLALRVYREGCTYRTRSLRGGPRYDIGSLIGQIPEKNALLRPPSSLSLPLSLSLSLSLSSFSAHVLSDENRPTTLVGSYLGILYRSNNNHSRPFRIESFAITIKRSVDDSCSFFPDQRSEIIIAIISIK